MIDSISLSSEHRTFLLEAVLVSVGAVAVAGIVLAPTAGLVAVIGCAALGAVKLIVRALRGRIDELVLWWAALFPLGYYFMSFPREHSIVTLDRAVVLVAFVGLFLVDRSTRIPVPTTLRRAGLAVLAFAAVAVVSLLQSSNFLNRAQNVLEGFVLPPLLGWCVIARFDARRRLPTIHTAVCTSSMICAAVAAAEMVVKEDLLPNQGSGIDYSGGGIPRPNGPFASNDTLALVGAVSLFFLLFLRAALGPKVSSGRRMLHSIGLTAAIGMALMPMFRSVAITLFLVLIVDTIWEIRTIRRARRVGLILASASLIFIAPLLVPEKVIEDRSSGQNVYGRIAQLDQSFHVFLDHPILGVGFYNFGSVVTGELRYVASYQGVNSVDSPHNNLTQVLAETGILGFMPYVIAHVLLLKGMWQLRRSSLSGSLAWKFCFYMFLAYWITGLTESSGYSPLNLLYVFAITVAHKLVITDPDLMQTVEVHLPEPAFSTAVQSSGAMFLR
jgi:O-antigen ligase